MNNTTGTVQIEPSFLTAVIDNEESDLDFEITLTNNDNRSINVSFASGQFTQNSQNLTNTMKRIPHYEEIFTLPSKNTIEADSQKTFNFSINPSKIEGYPISPALIVRIDGTSQQSIQTAANYEYALPIYIKNSNLDQSVKISKFQTTKTINLNKEVNIQTEIKSDSKTYIKPQGYIEFHQLELLNQQKTRINSIPLNNKSIILMPGSTHTHDYTWKRGEFGHYEATIYSYVQENKEPTIQTQTVDFWIIPPLFLLRLLGILALVSTAIFLLIRARKKRLIRKSLNTLQSKIKQVFKN
jgi:hypothetical protein